MQCFTMVSSYFYIFFRNFFVFATLCRIVLHRNEDNQSNQFQEKENAVVVIIIATDVLNVMKVKLGSITVSEQVKKAEEKRVRLRSDNTKYSKRHKNENIKYFARG